VAHQAKGNHVRKSIGRTGGLRRRLGVVAVGAVALAAAPLDGGASAQEQPSAPIDTSAFCEAVDDWAPFTDTVGDTFAPEIACAAFLEVARGGAGGRPATQYVPGLDVSREQMASFIVRMIDTANDLEVEEDGLAALPATAAPRFTDVPPGTSSRPNPHVDNINRLAAAGIVQGGPGGLPATRFGPGLPVSRSQMASFVNRAVGFLFGDAPGEKLPCGESVFVDVQGNAAVPPDARCDIHALAEVRIVVGAGTGLYNPGGAVNRGQMAGFLIRTLAFLHEDGLITEAAPPVVITINGSGRSGQPLTGVISGPAFASLGISGPCVVDDPDVDVAVDGRFAIPARAGFTGACTLTFTVTFDDGASASATFAVTIRSAAPSGIQLVDDEIVAGEAVAGTVTGEDPASLAVAGRCVADDLDVAVAADGSFSVPTLDAPTGPCPLTFTLTFDDGWTQVIRTTVAVAEPADRAEVVLDDPVVVAGTSLTGTVTGADLASLGVAGACVDDDDDVTLTAAGAFSIPTLADVAGACALTFTVTFDDGEVETTQTTVTVTAPAG
jgi:hypothetical protein